MKWHRRGPYYFASSWWDCPRCRAEIGPNDEIEAYEHDGEEVWAHAGCRPPSAARSGMTLRRWIELHADGLDAVLRYYAISGDDVSTLAYNLTAAAERVQEDADATRSRRRRRELAREARLLLGAQSLLSAAEAEWKR